MRHFKSTLLGAAAALCVAYATPALAQSSTAFSNANSNASFMRSQGAPGPLAGAGLPFLIVAGAVGAYKLIRRQQENRHRRGDTEQG